MASIQLDAGGEKIPWAQGKQKQLLTPRPSSSRLRSSRSWQRSAPGAGSYHPMAMAMAMGMAMGTVVAVFAFAAGSRFLRTTATH